MKAIPTFVFCLFFMGGFAQEIIDKNVGEFNEIKVFDLIAVNLIPSDDNRIVIKGWNTEDIIWSNKAGVLRLRMQLDKKFTGEDTLIEVFYTDTDVIDANEGAQITCSELVQQNKIELRAQEGARIKIGMDVSVAEIRAVTGGIVEASGLAKNQEIVVNTGGIFEGRELKSQISDVKVSAGGEVEIFASERADINIKAGGEVYVYGNPAELHKKTLVGGNITIMD
ncbi:Hypothetical protein I595_813 [Croceitalea dokdonensis DOKDO 023]|uniref:Putative auto-transporter adhesin head GIN domain-containing protein n=1 Tax=Croceitalea dokdonensis DOKDO 023 TaxID=1300341 RepID=A0A0P7B2D8_9FLAO|nr:head GIN domain-containing protein [Croceitalea dokdonensis]KPM32397.1 Hypothetical protein I595_813 [Croceitalea dokdonensis DOKDO 023]